MMQGAVQSQQHYRIFGLLVRSELPLPELVAADHHGDADVIIRLGRVPAAKTLRPGLHAWRSGAVLVVESVGRYFVTGGREILIDAVDDVPIQNVRLFLLGSALGLLAHQRGLLPLHANAVEIDGKAIAFLGRSGAGKSTLAAWFHDCGYRVIADDVCVVRFDDGGLPLATPGLPRLRLWSEALEATGREARSYIRSYAGTETFEKYDVPLDRERTVSRNVELGAIYVLEQGEQLRISELDGVASLEALFANTYRGRYVRPLGMTQQHYAACLKLVRHSHIFVARRSWDLSRLGSQAQELVEHAKAVISTQLPPQGGEGEAR